jgi:hypothetical protein
MGLNMLHIESRVRSARGPGLSILALSGALLLSVSQAGAATLTVTGSVGGAPTGITYVNFDDLAAGSAGGPSGGIGVSFSTDAAAVTGPSSGFYAEPYLSGGQGALFGDFSPSGPDTTQYLTSGSTGSFAGASITLTFPASELYMGLLWGSVDDYNTLSFYSGGVGGTHLGDVTGSDVLVSPNGDQGIFGTLYVNINSDTPFDTVVVTSSKYAFELDNVSYDVANQGGLVPLPATVWLFGSVLAGSGLFLGRRRKRKSVAAA